MMTPPQSPRDSNREVLKGSREGLSPLRGSKESLRLSRENLQPQQPSSDSQGKKQKMRRDNLTYIFLDSNSSPFIIRRRGPASNRIEVGASVSEPDIHSSNMGSPRNLYKSTSVDSHHVSFQTNNNDQDWAKFPIISPATPASPSASNQPYAPPYSVSPSGILAMSYLKYSNLYRSSRHRK
jgi:hypothetical protein